MHPASEKSKSKARTTSDSGEHLYVYCAVRGPVAARVAAKLPAMPDGSAPRAIPLTRDISLIVSDVSAATYRSEAIDKRLSDLNWVARCGAAHHAVVDELALKHTVVPFRLFTLFSNEARAVAAMRKAAKRIDQALERVRGKAEWVLRIGKPDRSVVGQPVKAAKTAAPPSGTAFLKSKAAAKQAAAETAARVRRDVSAVFAALDQAADQSTERAIDPQTALLLDAAFLVPVRQTAAFKRVLKQSAAGLLDAGCRVSLTGPWPPYSFVWEAGRADKAGRAGREKHRS